MKILMHMCCARCAAYPISKLTNDGIEVCGLYYNPNIHTDEEFEKRAESVIKFSEIQKFNVFYYPDLVVEVHSLEELDLTRYDLRIRRTFELGKDLGYDAVTTSLLANPNLDHENILEIGRKYSKMFDIPFYDEDFREGFLEGQEMIEKLGLY